MYNLICNNIRTYGYYIWDKIIVQNKMRKKLLYERNTYMQSDVKNIRLV